MKNVCNKNAQKIALDCIVNGIPVCVYVCGSENKYKNQ